MLNIKAKEAPIQIDEPDPEMENVYQEESTGGMVEEPAPISSEPSKKKATTMKVIVWVCLLNGLAWVWCSYILAALDKVQIAEELSKVALAEIIVPVAVYAFKSGVENLSKNNRWPDKGDTPEAEPEDTDPPGMG